MIILLRGHIRNSFDNPKLFYIIQYLSELYNIEIYIHTWHIVQSTVSWRQLEENNTQVTTELIYSYFKNLSKFIKHIIIDNDGNIKLIGNTDGIIIQTPLVGWKNMWYGKFRIIEYIKNNHQQNTILSKTTTNSIININKENENDNLVVNLRFDVFCNSNCFAFENVIKYINNIVIYKKNNPTDLARNIFMKNIPSCYGIDNIYVGNIFTMYKLCYHFHHHLDHILNIYKYNSKIKAQESLVVLENRRIFCEKNNIGGFFHPKYKRTYVPTIYGRNTGIGIKYRPPIIIERIKKQRPSIFKIYI